ncbi:hypothetical protein CCY99_04445 [Helicobacter sp. 16-1353]|uniref:peptidoglycan DD-metalloendopeptidase family protein n=1 Tax=Helicobacter sp. 16-1353 TaxID=2004996 RepID=UPI000DCD2F19|nr:peptidoglycan DD-metalloendopeptidase family protein [Helicobacter sp. 16-1353]RAX54266.1 hypothetical protein CCY99_04445 [Helicobacter sp. 16-1353]
MKNTNIRDRFIISIIDDNGIKQFNIHRLVKKIILYILLFIVISAIVVFFAIKILASELKEMQSKKDITLEKYSYIYNENENLKQQVEISQNKLNEINQTMLDLEDIINIKSNNFDVGNITPFDIRSLDNSQKTTILQLLPNSKPFDGEYSSLSSLKSGINFNIAKDTPIYATADGIVDLTRDKDTKGIGKFVKIVHSFGFTSIYGHLSKVNVKRGDIVRKGQLIGYSGKDSNIDSLYYDIRFLGSEVNVEDFIEWDIDNFDNIMKKDSIVNWNSLLWTFDDMMQINNHKIFIQHDNTLSMRVGDENIR